MFDWVVKTLLENSLFEKKRDFVKILGPKSKEIYQFVVVILLSAKFSIAQA